MLGHYMGGLVHILPKVPIFGTDVAPYPTVSIVDGRQDGRHLGPPYLRNPIWPPLGLEINRK